ncbi:MAG: MFS transporter, partial [Chloroflexota bacterium]|nr:MFS transporter [Chloroflexota bacterium]
MAKSVGLVPIPNREQPDEQATTFPEGRARWVLAAALLAVFVGSLDLTVIATLLPKIVSDLQINTADINRYVWVVSAYLLAYMVTIPVLGRVSDILGRRPAFAAALVIFLAGSILSARAGGLGSLIAGRAVQGFGGGALVPVTMALVGDLLPPRRRAAVIGLVGAIDTMGWVLGPLYGAALLGLTGSWRVIFWINVPITIITVLVLLFTWRGVRQQRIRERLDLAGAALLSASLVCLNLALSSGSEAGAGNGQLGGSANPLAAYRWPLLGGALVAFIGFILWERRAKAPLIPLSLFRLPVFSAATVANLLIGASLIVVMVDVPLFASLVEENPERASLIGAALLLPFTFMMAVGSVLGGI